MYYTYVFEYQLVTQNRFVFPESPLFHGESTECFGFSWIALDL